jgi:hypothetical protein
VAAWFRGPVAIDLGTWPCENNIMGPLWAKLRVPLAWLTATTLLVAATPHFHCVCPNGKVKRFCLNIASGPTGCCCGGSCCAGNQGGECCCQAPGRLAAEQNAEQPCCCCAATAQQPRQDTRPAGAAAHVQGKCCTKTPEGGFIAVTPEQGPERLGPSSGGLTLLVAAPGPALAAVAPHGGGWRLAWQSHQLPPPTDLVTTLQRLTI